MTHTKGEWVWYNGCSWWRLGTKEGSGHVDTLVICPTTASDNQPDLIISEDNRKRIIQCVNSHDKLVEALESIVHIRNSFHEDHAVGKATDMYRVAQQALKSAKGGV